MLNVNNPISNNQFKKFAVLTWPFHLINAERIVYSLISNIPAINLFSLTPAMRP